MDGWMDGWIIFGVYLKWWLDYMESFNGTVHMVDPRPVVPVSIDACSLGGGAYFMGDWVYSRWIGAAREAHINVKEVMALGPAVIRWAPHWKDKKVYVHSDNMTAVAAINKGHCKNPLAMEVLRGIFWASAIYNFRLRAKYYPGVQNRIADAISRLEMPNGVSHFMEVLQV